MRVVPHDSRFCFKILPPPIPPLFPYTTLFRSLYIRIDAPPQAARILRPLGLFSEMALLGSSHNRPTSAEDHEEALLLGCPPIGRSDRNREQFGRKRKRGLLSSA